MSSVSRPSAPAPASISHRPQTRLSAASDRARRAPGTPASWRRRGAEIVPVELTASILAAFTRGRQRHRLGTAKQRALASRRQAWTDTLICARLTYPRMKGRGDVRLDRGARGSTLKRRLLLALIAAAAVAGAVVSLTAHVARHREQGMVHFLGGSNQAFDRFTSGLDPSYGAFLRRHMWRMVVYSPYFDDKTRWYPNGWAYTDAYAIYRESALASQHPEWILRDQAGRPLFIPFACSRGGCPQYAADISNPAFRRQWIDRARASMAHGYRGLFIDDVNMAMRVGDGEERPVGPIDGATGRPMRDGAWRGYMAQFMEEVRAATSAAE